MRQKWRHTLPSPYGIGSMGKQAYKFVDFLAEAGQKDTVSGKFHPVPGMETNKNVYKKARFDKEADAVAWLDALAGIEAAEATTTATTGEETDI